MSGADALARLPPPVLADLRARYAEPQRRYHTWEHVGALLHWHDDRLADLARPEAVFHAIVYHDAIYDPARGDNEVRSAELLGGADLPALDPADRAQAIRLVLATEKHRVPEDLGKADAADAALFLDMDLSILGARADVFDVYEAQVRAEYAHVPEALFRAGRRRVLTGFLERDRLYFSPWGRERFETRARENVARSIAKLSG